MIHLLRLKNISIFEQLQIEEALLRSDTRNWCIVNIGSPPAIVMGISGNPHELISEESTLPVIRRFSGGGTVVVDEETCFFSLICNTFDLPIPGFPQPVLEFNGRLFQDILPPTFSIKENDYTLSEKKFGGNAQYFTKNRWAHHTTALWDYQSEKMQLLKIPKRMPSYRKERPHGDFLCCLKEVVPSKETLIEGFLEALNRYFYICEMDINAIQPILKTPHRKSTQKVSYANPKIKVNN